ncbi:MAG: GTP-binding protein, partial [Caldilineaceae bacterium]|nr:GTP-binding protein [Caldilineaceae bacterium]
LAVIVNEFGDIGIDGALVDDAKQIEIPGGCVCCLRTEELALGLRELLGSNDPPDALLIETTGIAEPQPIAWSLEEIDGVVLRGFVCVVDPVHFSEQRGALPSCETQVQNASVLVISHLDEHDGRDAWRKLAPTIHAINDSAIVIDVSDQRARQVWSWLHQELSTPPLVLPASAQHHHHEQVESVSVPAHGLLDIEELASELESLPPGYWRVKGVVAGQDNTCDPPVTGHFAIHRVGGRVSWQAVSAPAQDPCVVAIGRSIGASALEAAIHLALIGGS